MDNREKTDGKQVFPEQLSAAEAYLLCTPSGRVRFQSPAAEKLLEGELTGRNLNDFLEDRLAARLIGTAFSGEETEFRCTVGGRGLSGKASPLEDGEGMLITLFPLNRSGLDRAGLRCAAQLLVRELNSSLGVLLPASQRMEESASAEQETYLAIMKMHIYRMMRMAHNLDDMTAVESGTLHLSFREVDLRELCADLLDRTEPYCTALGITLRRRLPEEPVLCHADPEKVERMLLNLLSNAMQAQPGGGTIVVSLQEKEEDRLVLSVSDRGCGLSDPAAGNVYRKFEWADPLRSGGLGLGLSLTRAFAEGHGGQLILMSGEEGGLCARIILPRNRELPVEEVCAWRSGYGTGIDPVQAELSGVAKKERFLRKKEET